MTKMQRETIDAILDFTDLAGEGPSISALARAMRAPVSTIHYRVSRLRKRGLVISRGRQLLIADGRVHRRHVLAAALETVRKHAQRHQLDLVVLERSLERRILRVPASE